MVKNNAYGYLDILEAIRLAVEEEREHVALMIESLHRDVPDWTTSFRSACDLIDEAVRTGATSNDLYSE